MMMMATDSRLCVHCVAMPKTEKITAEGLDELCANALQLVNDNKVNMKNCFDVELIEHIGELMKGYESGGEMNFHRAAGTLDASARIYAYRVDQVHSDAFKVWAENEMSKYH